MIVGNKAALLGEFAKSRQIQIPRGFVVPAYVFDATIVAGGIYASLYQRIHGTNFEDRKDIEHTARFAMRKIQSMHIPEFMLVEIAQAARKLEHGVFAVRSSAIVEDGTELSWAGQFETVLGASISTLEQDIKKAWASMFSYKALSYRATHKRIHDPYSMAVIVQELVPAHVSGVGFSAHPNPGFEDIHTVEAVSGMGNVLVSGKENPDSYVIEKRGHTLIDASIVVQKRENVLVGGKLTLKKLSRLQGARMLLSREDVKILSRSMRFLEKRLGVPVDIEWAKYKNKIILLQARPITYKTSHTEIYTHKLVWYQQVQSFLATEIWSASERYAKKLLGIDAIADPIFVHNLNSGVDVYYHKEDIRNKPILLLEFYKNNPVLFAETFKHYMKLVDEMKSVDFLKRPFTEIFNVLEQAWPFMGVLYILLDLRDRGVRLPKWLEKKVVHARIVGEKVSHRVFSYILTERETAIGEPVKGFYYTDFLTKEEIVSGTSVPASKLRQRGRRTFAYYQDEIYTGKQARQLIKEKTFITNLNSLTNDGKLSGRRIYPGKISGFVYVSSMHADMYNMPNGYILVTKSLSPECVSFLPEGVAGIIIEEGGEFSHGAILARERKIPCIVGVKNITKILKTDDEIFVCANSVVLKPKNNGVSS
jgi:phosphoenolpyruvate synthase/pyruvate phosphate dikinase